MRSADARSRCDSYLGVAGIIMAVAYLFGVAAGITYAALGRVAFLGSGLLETGWGLQVCGPALLVAAFAGMAVALFNGGDVRRPRLRRSLLVLAVGYGIMLVGSVLIVLPYHRGPEPSVGGRLAGSTIMQTAAYLAAAVGALLAASALAGPRVLGPEDAAFRNRRLGWASVAIGVEFALLFSSTLAEPSTSQRGRPCHRGGGARAVPAA